jgi:alkylation response protein AidB-like acyl-CoA dehydrogenase
MVAEGRLDLPFPGGGATPMRHKRLADIGRENLALARLAEAHVDALAILHEAGRNPHPGALYGVWASETSSHSLIMTGAADRFELSGTKMFCTGATIVDRALITVMRPERLLLEVDLRSEANRVKYDESAWVASAFEDTHTATAFFTGMCVCASNVMGAAEWYLSRPGFWSGACGPAACWAGGAWGLLDYAIAHTRGNNPHAVAHLGGIEAGVWGMRAALEEAGREIDGAPEDTASAMRRALIVRHLVEEACTEVLRRFSRAFGPRPMAFDAAISRRCQELALYIRQSHAECDLETLGTRSISAAPIVSSPG